MFQIQKTTKFWIAVSLTTIAGILYCSWPLGYWLNPAVSHHGLASELAALHQPYNWVFIGLDVLTGILITIAVTLLWQRRQDTLHTVVLINLALFGIFTLIDALLPMTCEPSLTACPSLSHQPMLIAHGVASITASVCLFVSVLLVWWARRRKPGTVIMTGFLVGWSLFGILSVYFFFVPGPGYLAQHYYITLCSMYVALLPFMLIDFSSTNSRTGRKRHIQK